LHIGERGKVSANGGQTGRDHWQTDYFLTQKKRSMSSRKRMTPSSRPVSNINEEPLDADGSLRTVVTRKSLYIDAM
jgi:hypothetical protein